MKDSEKERNKLRIEAVVEYSKKNKRELGISLGHSSGTLLSNVISGRNGISIKLANQITNLFPEISYDWLLKGKGEMLIPVKKQSTELEDRVAFLERHIKGQDARIELLELKMMNFPKIEAPNTSDNKVHV